MNLMLLRITIFFHVSNLLVYPILVKLSLNNLSPCQEENDQAFFISL